MNDDIPSKTAFRVAQHRSAHQLLDDPLVFPDALASRIVGRDSGTLPEADRARHQHPLSRALRAFVAVRSRLAEDELLKAAGRGMSQYVILGAGLDTFAYRDPRTGLRVFEVDHPATQHWKQTLLQEAGIAIPASMTFVPVDFEKQTVPQVLGQVGFQHDQPAFFSWLGVVPYLSEAAFAQSLHWMGSMPAGSSVVFDYATDPGELGEVERAAFAELARRVALAGEPFRLFRDPVALAAELSAAGFSHTEDLDGGELNARYFAGRTDRLHVGGRLGRIIRAWK